jgi:hypothetical protein
MLTSNHVSSYITDLDRWSILAIATTAPYSQVSVLRHSIYRYLAFKTSIGVSLLASIHYFVFTYPRINRLSQILTYYLSLKGFAPLN